MVSRFLRILVLAFEKILTHVFTFFGKTISIYIYIIYRFANRLLVTAQGRFNHGGRDLISIGAFAPYATQSNELQNS